MRVIYLILALVYPQIYSHVNYIVDGDTLDTSLGRVRILGINTPEKGERCFNESVGYVKSLNLKDVKLERDLVNKDKYDRFLRHVYYGESLGLNLIKEGLAKSYCIFPNTKYCNEFIDAQKKAMDGEVGCLWKKSNNTCVIISEIDKKSEVIEITNICQSEVVLDGVYVASDGRSKEEFYGLLCSKCSSEKSFRVGKFALLFDRKGLIDYRVS